jgi:hypothetical protein
MPAKVTHKVKIEETQSAKWLRGRATEGKLSIMLTPADLPDGVKPGQTVTLTITK